MEDPYVRVAKRPQLGFGKYMECHTMPTHYVENTAVRGATTVQKPFKIFTPANYTLRTRVEYSLLWILRVSKIPRLSLLVFTFKVIVALNTSAHLQRVAQGRITRTFNGDRGSSSVTIKRKNDSSFRNLRTYLVSDDPINIRLRVLITERAYRLRALSASTGKHSRPTSLPNRLP